METNGEYKIEQEKWSTKKILLLCLGLLAVVVIVALVYYFTKISQPYSQQSREMNFMVAKGSSTRQTAEALGSEKIISSPTLFIVYAALHGAGNKIEAGDYVLNANMNISEIVDVLTHGRVVSSARTVTTIEGWTNAQIASDLTQSHIIAQDSDFLNQLQSGMFSFKFAADAKAFQYQGFLFPDTYKINRTDGSNVLIQKMLSNFETKFTDKMSADMQAAGRNMKDVITLASIIEKEVGRNKSTLTDSDLATLQTEREEVASVFYNRLKIGMPLESDATVNYVTDKADRSVTTADTKIKSPYNTYQVKGLPPTPISNPGIGSIMAAIYPANTDYLYFLNAPDGTAVFAKTLAQHNANKAKYLK